MSASHGPYISTSLRRWSIAAGLFGWLLCASGHAADWCLVAGVSPAWTPSDNHTVVVFDDQLYALGGWGRAFHAVWASANGEQWVQVQDDPAWSGRAYHTSVVYEDKVWIIGGADNPETPIWDGSVWASSDGVTWEEVLHLAPWVDDYSAAPRMHHSSVVFNGRMWLLGGLERAWSEGVEFVVIDTYHHDVWSSEDGVAWEYVADAPWPGRYSHTSVVFDGKIWIIGGIAEVGEHHRSHNDVWSSEDGITWTEVTHRAPWCPRKDHASVVYGGMLWVIGGHTYADTWASPDGVSWICVTDNGPFGERFGHTCTVYDGKIWLMGGRPAFNDPDSYTDVWTFELGAEGEGEGEGEGAVELEGVDWVHAADRDGDAAINLRELLRVIQFYNVGGYQCAEGTEDGYAPGAGDTACTPHSSDYNPQDWTVDMSELLRLVQLYNSDGYCYYPGHDSEDGYWPCNLP